MQDFNVNTSDANFIQDVLDKHNSYRSRHKVPKLVHNPELDKSALEWAMHLLDQSQLSNCEKSTKGEIGENISMRISNTSSVVNISGIEVVQQWYRDKTKYNFELGADTAGNFTQLVWASTKELGVARVAKPGKCIIVVQYRPPGNVHGQYITNVFPASDYSENTIQSPVSAPNVVKERESTLIESETDTELNGKTVLYRRVLREYIDKSGNITKSIEQTRLNDDDLSDNDFNNSKMDSNKSKSFKSHDYLFGDGEISKKFVASEADDFFIEQIIARHNHYRALHNTKPLIHNKALSKQAQSWALNLSKQNYLSNSDNQFDSLRVGENIASRWSNEPCDFSANEVADNWYNESQRYNYTKEHLSVQGIGNFTQLIWGSSREIGVGKIRCKCKDSDKSYRVIVVCQYSPPGNIFELFAANVLPMNI